MLPGDIDPNGDFRQQLMAALQDPEVVNLLHQYSDYDTTPDGLHRSQGLRHDQSSYGDHTHTGKDSAGVTELLAANGNAVTYDGSTLVLPNTTAFGQTYQALTMQNGWVNHGSGYSILAIEQFGPYVILKGIINSGTFTSGTVITNIAAPLRPDGHRVFPVVCNASGANDVFGSLTLNTNTGDIIVDTLPGNTLVCIQTMWSVR